MNIGKITLTYFEVILFSSFSSKEILRDVPLFEVSGNAYLIIFLYTKFPDPKQEISFSLRTFKFESKDISKF